MNSSRTEVFPSEVSGLVDEAALRAWMDARGRGRGPLRDVRVLTGGTQNVLLRFRRDDKDYVLRRGPRHLRSSTNDHLRKEMRVLAALAGTNVPHPALLEACPAEDVLGGSVFYLMEPIDGDNPTISLPDSYEQPALRHRLGLSVVEALAALGAVDHRAVGLGDLGYPDGFLERQVPQWLRHLESYAAFDGYPAGSLPHVESVAGWLERHRPATFVPGILHGDFHLANVLVDDAGEVLAVVDWEMTTIGDPLLDLGWLLATWPEPGRPDILDSVIGAAGGLPSQFEVVEHYAARSQRDLSHVDWYVTLACFKLGIVLEGTHARACAGLAPGQTGERLRDAARVLLSRAAELAGA